MSCLSGLLFFLTTSYTASVLHVHKYFNVCTLYVCTYTLSGGNNIWPGNYWMWIQNSSMSLTS